MIIIWHVQYTDFANQIVRLNFRTQGMAVEWARWAESTGYEPVTYWFE